jgi:hypothetical protein
VAALSPAFEGTTRAEMERLGLASGSSTAHEVSKEIAYAILELAIGRLVKERVDAIHDAQEAPPLPGSELPPQPFVPRYSQVEPPPS